MDLNPPGRLEQERTGHRPIWTDLWRAYAGVIGGFATALLVLWLVQTWDFASSVVAFVAGPVLLSSSLILFSRGSRNRRIVRLAGAMLGWIVFLWILINPESQQWLLFFYHVAPRLEFVAFFVVALALVTVGLIGADRTWSLIRGAREPEAPVRR